MEVVNFLKKGGFNKSERQRSLTQPDLSEDLSKFKENRIRTTHAVAVHKLISLKKRSDEGICLAEELDALKVGDATLPKASPASNPVEYPRGLKPKSSPAGKISDSDSDDKKVKISFEMGKDAGKTDQPRRRSNSVSDLLARLENGSVIETVTIPSAIPRLNSPPLQHKDSTNVNGFNLGSLAQVTGDRNTNSLEEQKAIMPFANKEVHSHVPFDSDLKSPSLSRSSGTASSLLSERLYQLSFNSDERRFSQQQVDCLVKTSSVSPRIVITPVDDLEKSPLDNALEEVFRPRSGESTLNLNDFVDEDTQTLSRPVSASNPDCLKRTLDGFRLQLPSTFQVGIEA